MRQTVLQAPADIPLYFSMEIQKKFDFSQENNNISINQKLNIID